MNLLVNTKFHPPKSRGKRAEIAQRLADARQNLPAVPRRTSPRFARQEPATNVSSV